MLKKAGIVTFGVSAALVAAAPFASAGDATAAKSDSGSNNSSHSKDHGKGHGKHHGSNNTSCKSESGDVKKNKGMGIGSILDGNSGQILSCNSLLNGVAKDNHISIGSHILDGPEVPEVPEV